MAGMHARQHMLLLHAMQHHHHVADATHIMDGMVLFFFLCFKYVHPPHASSITPTPL
jgi:hypothetical protein